MRGSHHRRGAGPSHCRSSDSPQAVAPTRHQGVLTSVASGAAVDAIAAMAMMPHIRYSLRGFVQFNEPARAGSARIIQRQVSRLGQSFCGLRSGVVGEVPRPHPHQARSRLAYDPLPSPATRFHAATRGGSGREVGTGPGPTCHNFRPLSRLARQFRRSRLTTRHPLHRVSSRACGF